MKIFKIASEAGGIDLWLDDERNPLDPRIKQLYGSKGTETWVKTVEEAITYLQSGNVSSISFDNDLGQGLKEGKHLATWIEEQAYYKKLPKLAWRVHSMNPSGKKEIMDAMANADRFWNS